MQSVDAHGNLARKRTFQYLQNVILHYTLAPALHCSVVGKPPTPLEVHSQREKER